MEKNLQGSVPILAATGAEVAAPSKVSSHRLSTSGFNLRGVIREHNVVFLPWLVFFYSSTLLCNL